MGYFGTNNRLFKYALCVILPTGQWGTPHYSLPATEEWLHLTAIWGTWYTSNIENHLWGPSCVIFDHIIQTRCLSFRGDSQPAREEHPLLPTGHWGMAAFDSNMGHVKHIKHWKPCLEALMCYFGTNNRLLKYALCVILPTGQWGTSNYSQQATEKRQLYGVIGHIKHWKPSRGALMCHLGTNNRLLKYALRVILPTGLWGMAAFDSNMGHVKYIKLWKPCLGTLMCHLGTNNRVLKYALCVILPNSQWGTPHYSQPAPEEWLHLTAILGTWNTSNIENHLGGPRCVIFAHIIQSWNLSDSGDSHPASEERPLLPNGHWGTAAVWVDRAH